MGRSNTIRVCEWCGMDFLSPAPSPRCCSKSCGQKLRNKKESKGEKEERACEECGKPFFVIKGHQHQKRFCGKSCHGRYRNRQPEFRNKLYSPVVGQKISQSLREFAQTSEGQAQAKRVSQRMKEKNPSRLLSAIGKGQETKRIRGTDGWRGVRGGNGQLTLAQVNLWRALQHHSILDWDMEIAIPTKVKPMSGAGIPTNYKVDIGCTLIQLAVEVDGNGHRSRKSMLRDIKKRLVLESLGWTVLRFTNQEILEDCSEVVSQIWMCVEGMSNSTISK